MQSSWETLLSLLSYVDRQKEERERGVIITCAVKEFSTDTWHYNIVDAPGHWIASKT